MAKKRTLKLCTLIGAVLSLCFTCLSVFVVRANGESTAQAGITVYENYDIATASEGKYANYFIDSNNYTTAYWKTNYSGDTINFHSGRLYEAEAKSANSTVRLFDEYSGAFSIVGQGFYDQIKNANNEFKPDYKRLAFQFTNLENPSQYLKFSFTQSVSNYLELNIYYYDKGINATSKISTYKMQYSRASFTGKVNYFNSKNIPFKFKYDMATGALNFSNESGVLDHNLTTTTLFTDAGTANLKFTSYAVDMHFEDRNGYTAKFIAYELCGENLSDRVSVTVQGMDGETVATYGATKGKQFVLPANATKGFVGYAIGDKIYPAGYALTVEEEITIKQMVIAPIMVAGASVRKQSTDGFVGGIRFLVTVDEEAIGAFGENIAMYGVLIYTDNIVGDFDLNEAGSQCKVLTNYYQKDGVRGYYITLTNIQPKNYTTSYSARAYLEVTLYDGSTVKVATDYTEADNARSPYQVALVAESKGENGPMIDAYLGRTPNAQN